MNWELDQYKHRPFKVVLKELSEFAIERFNATQLFQVASSLTLTTVLSLVPLLAVILVSFAVFPSFEASRAQLEAFIFQSLLPEGYREQIIRYIRDFSNHASGLTAFGLMGLGVTSLMLINTIDETLNRIFHVRKMRSMMRRVLIYWALLTLGPLVIAGSLTLTKSMAVDDALLSGLSSTVTLGLQFVIQTLGYAALYVYVPNCHVSWRSALFGGGVVTLAGIVVKWGFSVYLSAGPLSSIYGAFTAIPVVLLWIYFSWILVLAGAAITATIPMLMSGRFADTHRTGNDFITGMVLLHALMIAQEQGRSSMSIHALCNASDSYPEAAGSILERLADVGYVGRLEVDGGEERWGLLVNPQQTTLRAAFGVLLVDPTNTLIAREDAPLYDWFMLMSDADWNHRPMTETLRYIHPL